MKSLRWLAPVLCLLFVGVLMAPVPSEAQVAPPRLTLTVGQSTINVPLGGEGSSTCVPAEDAFTTCYNIPPGPYCFTGECDPETSTTTWIIGDYSATTTSTNDDTVHARLIVTDNSGAGLDIFRMAGVTFKPGINNTGTKTLTVEYSNAFNGRSNTGQYVMGLLIGGNYNAGAGATNFNRTNAINYSGSGIFCSGECAPQPIGSPLSSTVSSRSFLKIVGIGVNGTASLQSPTGIPLPSFDCNTGEGRCAPTITQRVDVTVTDFDQLALASSTHADGCFQPNGESNIETFSATTTTLTCRQQIRQDLRRVARQEARALRLVSGRHFKCPVCKEGHEDEECDDHDNDRD